MIFYIQKNTDDYITDIITYPYSNYEQIEIAPPLPDGVTGGWYKFSNNTFIFDPIKFAKLNPKTESDYITEIEDLRKANNILMGVSE